MSPKKERPADAGTSDEADFAKLHGSQNHHNSRRKAGKPILTFRLEPEGDPLTVIGREAQTLALLIKCGRHGFTSGEASPLGWARRTSHYVHKLRSHGVAITTTDELLPDGAKIGRYRLSRPVYVNGREAPALSGAEEIEARTLSLLGEVAA